MSKSKKGKPPHTIEYYWRLHTFVYPCPELVWVGQFQHSVPLTANYLKELKNQTILMLAKGNE